jgi:hypothetical protein
LKLLIQHYRFFSDPPLLLNPRVAKLRQAWSNIEHRVYGEHQQQQNQEMSVGGKEIDASEVLGNVQEIFGSKLFFDTLGNFNLPDSTENPTGL